MFQLPNDPPHYQSLISEILITPNGNLRLTYATDDILFDTTLDSHAVLDEVATWGLTLSRARYFGSFRLEFDLTSQTWTFASNEKGQRHYTNGNTLHRASAFKDNPTKPAWQHFQTLIETFISPWLLANQDKIREGQRVALGNNLNGLYGDLHKLRSELSAQETHAKQ